jgi:hypothetical protein
MPGSIRVAMPREPDFLRSTVVEGRRVQVGIAEDADRGLVVGLVVRAEKDAFINGTPAVIGYLGGWRVRPASGSFAVLRRGCDFVRGCHEAGRARLYLQTIVAGNDKAASLLRSGRLGLPTVKDFGRLRTFLLRPSAENRLSAPPDTVIRRGRDGDLGPVLEFLNSRHGSRRQFFPVYREADFKMTSGLLRGLATQDLFLAWKGSDLVGTLGLWDQSAYKQNRVVGYGPWTARLRPLLNAYSRLRSRPTLPSAGSDVKHLSLAVACVAGEDAGIFAGLLKTALRAARERPGFEYVAALFHERDPLGAVLRKLPGITYSSTLYVGHYADGEAALAALDGRIPYIELGSL